MQPSTALTPAYDHNDQCVGCGAHRADPCDLDCAFETGEIRPSVLLRTAAQQLHLFSLHRGADVEGAIAFAAAILTPDHWMGNADEPYELAHEGRLALVAYFNHLLVGADCGVVDEDMIHAFGRLAPRSIIAAQLYRASAHADGIDLEVEDGEFTSYDDTSSLAVRGCSCGMADYGMPGHDGAPSTGDRV